MQTATLGAMTFIHKDEDLTHGSAGLRLQFTDKGVEIIDITATKLVDQ